MREECARDKHVGGWLSACRRRPLLWEHTRRQSSSSDITRSKHTPPNITRLQLLLEEPTHPYDPVFRTDCALLITFSLCGRTINEYGTREGRAVVAGTGADVKEGIKRRSQN